MRFLQGMLVAHYRGNGKSNALEVFRIPESEHNSFFKWLKVFDTKMFHNMKTTYGFVKLGNRKVLTQLSTEYLKVNPLTTIGWHTVPMQSNSIVLWVGPHRVHHAKSKKDIDNYRSVLYLNIQNTPPQDELPETSTEECFRNHTQGKQINHSLELVLKHFCEQQNKMYGWNKQTIPKQYHSLFSSSADKTENKIKTQNTHTATTQYMQQLRDNGFVVIPNVLPDEDALQLHHTITECARTILFRVPRKGMCSELQKKVLQWSSHTFASQLNEPILKKARYFKNNTPDVFCGYDKNDAESRKMCNLQGVQGITLSSQMIDIYSHPFFAQCLIQIHPILQQALGTTAFYFGKERCSLRSYGSAPLEAHIDESISKISIP